MSEQTPGSVQTVSPGEPEPESEPQSEPQPETETETEAAARPEQPETEAPAPLPGQAQEPAQPLGALQIQPDPYFVPQQPPKAKRRFPWRWVGASVLTLAVGSGCAFGVIAVKRTDIPGLATAADGRYDFAPLVLPALAPGQTDPNDAGNEGGQHLADIRELLLPAPEGATRDAALPGATGWVTESATLALLGAAASAENLATDGWRHTAGVSWTTPDGAETKIYLLQFIDAVAAGDAGSGFNGFGGVDSSQPQYFSVNGVTPVSYQKSVHGGTATWYGEVQVRDTEFLIVYQAPDSVGIAPFEQEADLQVELLQ